MVLVFAQLAASCWFLRASFARVPEDIVHSRFVLGWYQLIVMQVYIVTIDI